MLLAHLAALIVAAAPSPCIDPATDLRALVLAHMPADRLAGSGSERMASAFTQFMRTGTRDDFLTARRRYSTALGGDHDVAARSLIMGLIHAASPDLNPANTRGYRHRRLTMHTMAEANVVRFLSRSAQLDPSLWLSGVALARTALGTRSDRALDAASTALRLILAHDEANVAARIALADVLTARDSAGEAVRLLRGLETRCAPAAHALAEALAVQGDTMTAGVVYLEGLARAPDDQLSRFSEDVVLLLPLSQRASYDSVAPSMRREWIQDFWERSAAASARLLRARVGVHLSRAHYAQTHYRKAKNPFNPFASFDRDVASFSTVEEERGPAVPGITPYDQILFAISPAWDERGEVLLRHGQPDTAVSTPDGLLIYMPRNLSWIYQRGNPPWMVHFTRDLGPDWAIAGPYIGCGKNGLPPQIGRVPITTHQPSSGGGVFASIYYSDRAAWSRFMDTFAKGCTAGAPQLAQAIKDAQQEYAVQMDAMLGTESAPRRLEHPMRLRIASYAFRDAERRPEIGTVAWVPAADMSAGGAPAVLRLNFALVGANGRPAVKDTAVAVPASVRHEDAVLGVGVRWAGRYPRDAQLHVFAVDDADADRGAYADVRVTLPDTVNAHAMSSIVIGEPGTTGPLARGSYRVAPHPDHIVLLGQPFRLFYELYGLEQDEALGTTIIVRRTDQSNIDALRERFGGRSSIREIQFERSADLDARGIVVHDVEIGGDLLPGEYTVEISVASDGGEI
ncbi:MAG TPA: hypothetical protein VHG09_03810, partial [Longimicrobiales bacterium]|nr:hypothetical protein [Longimicrobiales bacterium]